MDLINRINALREAALGFVMHHTLHLFDRWATRRLLVAEHNGEREAVLESRELRAALAQARNLALPTESENHTGDSSAKCPMRATDAPRQGKDTTE